MLTLMIIPVFKGSKLDTIKAIGITLSLDAITIILTILV